MEHRSRTRLVAALVLATVFASGILLGYAADGSGVAGDVAAAPSDEEEASTERRRRVPVYELMSPTDEQRVVIDSIMRSHRKQMNSLHADFDVAQQAYRTSYDAMIHDTREAIAAVFPPEAAAEYRRLLAENDRRREERRASEEGRATGDAPRD